MREISPFSWLIHFLLFWLTPSNRGDMASLQTVGWTTPSGLAINEAAAASHDEDIAVHKQMGKAEGS